ncbi:MAG: S46 family peptidase [Bacteroidales bacterium]|nr:S46 family peptidase [Candidatus Scybalousia scybalohippi]
MKKTFLTVLAMVAMLGSSFAGQAPKSAPGPDEGMWLPMFFKNLNYADMQKKGLKLTAEELYSFNNSSLKDAIVQMGQFCTGEMVSDKGLMFTNHHCGYDAIASSSTVEHDYLTDGFWANSYEEEIPIPGLFVSFLREMQDVTKEVLGSHAKDLNKSRYAQEIQNKIDELKKEHSEDGKYRVEIKSFFEGNEYYMFVYEQFNDVRLVGAPPSAIGKFGGDTDNWMWPRHTGDFSIFRIYADKDNNPAEYSKDNVPYTPKHYLPVNIQGVEENDFAMIWGYPGSTERYMTSYEVENTLNVTNPTLIKAGDYMLPVMKKNMDRDNAVRLKYASDYASMMNTWKNKQGESRGLKRLKVYDKKKAIEDRLEAWIKADDSRSQYANVIKELRESSKAIANSPSNQSAWYHNMGLYLSKRTILALQINFSVMAYEAMGNLTPELIEKLKTVGQSHFKSYDQQTEKELFAALIKMEMEIPSAYQVKELVDMVNKAGGVEKFVDNAFKKSVFANEANFNKFMAKPKYKTLAKDPIALVASSLYAALTGEDETTEQANVKFADARQNFVQALKEMDASLVRYPDANFTMRMTYGSVLDYYPADAIHYAYTTTIDGIMEKEDPNNDEFIVPARLKKLYETKDYGQYADKNGNMTVCFLTNNDITGGNSGSPVINAKGELIGLAFDGNWEAMSGDIAFEPELQRTICVDARYVLFVIDKFANCQRLINELKIVK